jgi:hydroxysqualene synthase
MAQLVFCQPYATHHFARRIISSDLALPRYLLPAENFPVASLLLPTRTRSLVVRFYRLARLADDIADEPGLLAPQRQDMLDALEAAAFDGRDDASVWTAPARRFRSVVAEVPAAEGYMRELLGAFRADTLLGIVPDWEGLLASCRQSAVPVGRFMLAAHSQPVEAIGPVDSLCIGLQLINHLQDCGEDWRVRGRCYLPANWLSEAGSTPQALAGMKADSALRLVFSRLLDEIDRLLNEATQMLPRLVGKGIRTEAAVTLYLAREQALYLRSADPLKGNRRPSWWKSALATVKGLVAGLRA